MTWLPIHYLDKLSDDHSADAPRQTIMGDGAPLEELDHEKSLFDASAPVKSHGANGLYYQHYEKPGREGHT